MTDRLVDWALADRIACTVAGEGPAWLGAGEAELRRESERAIEIVSDYTGLHAVTGIPPAELIDREQWVDSSLDSFQDISAELEKELAERSQMPSGVARRFGSVAAGVEVGLATGYLAQKVVGQYDVALFGPARTPRLLFVAPNLAAARERLQAEPDPFLHWIALHEGTHALQFAAVPWLREYIGELARELLTKASMDVKASDVISKLLGLGPRGIVEAVGRGELATLFWTEPQMELVDRLTAVMTVVEGYAEHVMDAAASEMGEGVENLRTSLERDRGSRGTLDQVVARLLGLDAKLAQYRRGKAFCDGVVESHGIDTLNRVWRSAEDLPTLDELDDPDSWVARVGTSRFPRVHPMRRLRGFFRRRASTA